MVHIIAVKHLDDFMKANPAFSQSIAAWKTIVESCEWKKPQDIVETFGEKAIDLLGKKDKKKGTVSCNRVVFDIKGNQIRVIAKYQFHEKLKKSRLYLKWIGDHKDYSELCKDNSQYDVDMFKPKKD